MHGARKATLGGASAVDVELQQRPACSAAMPSELLLARNQNEAQASELRALHQQNQAANSQLVALYQQLDAQAVELHALRQENTALREGMKHLRVERNRELAFSPSPTGAATDAYEQLHDDDISVPAGERFSAPVDARGLCLPNTICKQSWDTAVMLCVCLSAWLEPLVIAFALDSPPQWRWSQQLTRAEWLWRSQTLLSLVLLADCALTFNTAVLVGREWVTSRVAIASLYARGWLWADAASSIPLELIVFWQPGSAAELAPVLLTLKWVRVTRMLRLQRLLPITDAWLALLEERFDVSLRSVRILRSVRRRVANRARCTLTHTRAHAPWLHIVGQPTVCFWGTGVHRRSRRLRPYQVVLLYYLGHVLGCYFFYLASLDRDNSWVAAFDPDGSWGARGESLWDQPVQVQYLTGLYWALTTLTTVDYVSCAVSSQHLAERPAPNPRDTRELAHRTGRHHATDRERARVRASRPAGRVPRLRRLRR